MLSENQNAHEGYIQSSTWAHIIMNIHTKEKKGGQQNHNLSLTKGPLSSNSTRLSPQKKISEMCSKLK